SWLDAITAPLPAPDKLAAVATEQAQLSSPLADETEYVKKRRRLELMDFAQDIEARKGYANKLFWLIAVWLFLILELLTASGLGRIYWLPFKLSDAVLITLIGSTTATVFGLFLV